MPKVISDSSPLIHLTAIGHLELIRDTYSKIIVPTAVWHEVVMDGENRSGAMEVQQARDQGWIEIVEPGDQALPFDATQGRLQRDRCAWPLRWLRTPMQRQIQVGL